MRFSISVEQLSFKQINQASETHCLLLIGRHSTSPDVAYFIRVLLDVPKYKLSVNTPSRDYVWIGGAEFETRDIVWTFQEQLLKKQKTL